ncbi:MAG: hypothetical protein ACSLFB_04805 [Acidimicrobiales bacterium]
MNGLHKVAKATGGELQLVVRYPDTGAITLVVDQQEASAGRTVKNQLTRSSMEDMHDRRWIHENAPNQGVQWVHVSRGHTDFELSATRRKGGGDVR